MPVKQGTRPPGQRPAARQSVARPAPGRQPGPATRRPAPAAKRPAPKRPGRKKRVWPWLVSALLVVLLGGLWLYWSFVWTPQREKLSYPLHYREEILLCAEEFSLEPCLVAALVFCESSFSPSAVSSAGATGLAQIMPETGEWLAGKLDISDYQPDMLLDPYTNLRMGCWYLRYLLDLFSGQRQEALTAYNAGQGTVNKWLQDPSLSLDGKTLISDKIPGRDAKEYAKKVEQHYEKYLEIYGPDLDPEHQP